MAASISHISRKRPTGVYGPGTVIATAALEILAKLGE